jgi:predicted NAD/FAD-binding protein
MSRIAVIGAGISGMAAAHLLSQKHEVWLFEKENRLGGHTHTHRVETSKGVMPIDTGFIVHNDRTYPNLVRLFGKLGVERQASDMSFGVSCRETGFEYSSRGLSGFFGRENFLRLRQYRLLAEVMRFNRQARRLLLDPANSEVTLGEYLRANSFSDDFSRHYLHPMAASVWSTSLDEIVEFPAFTLIRFFENHGFLGLTTQAKWYAVKGGSTSYIAPLVAPFKERVRLGAGIRGVTRSSPGVRIAFENTPPENFDEVVFACHAPQTVALLKDASPSEARSLGQFRTSRNDALLHTDSRLLPRRPSARASWNYHLGAGSRPATLTYHMNRLQCLPVPEDYCVTLNDTSVERARVVREMTYFHPLYTADAVRSQASWPLISGINHTHFCGAYWFYGFHEDGLNSAIRVAEKLGASWQAAL